MARMRTYVCGGGTIVVGIVMVGRAQDRNDQGNSNSGAPFQTKQVFSGTFTVPTEGGTTKLASLDLSPYSNVRLEETVLASSTTAGVLLSLSPAGCGSDCIISPAENAYSFSRFNSV